MFQFGGFDISDSVVLNAWLGLAGDGSVVVCGLKDEVDVTNSCDGDSDGGSIIGSEWCLNPRVFVVDCSWLGKLIVVSFVVNSVIRGCGII